MDISILTSFLPEIFFSFCILSFLLYNIFIIKYNKYNFPILDKENLFKCIFIIHCCILLLYKIQIEGELFNHSIINTLGINFFKIIVLILSIIILIPCWRHYINDKLNFNEYFSLFLLAVLAFILILNVNDLLLVYLLLEIQSLIFYTLASFKRESAFSTEAGLKYFISGSIFSGIFLLGCSILYGILGTLNYYNLELLLSISLTNFSLEYLISISILLITVIFFFKLAIAPFHFWSPDVYEGAPISSTIILATIPKLILICVLTRWMSINYYIFINLSFIFISLGLLSIIFGIFFANRQKRLKRFIVYSSISQLGYITILLSIISFDTFAGVYFFIIIYLIASIAIWTFIILFNTFSININIFFLKEKVAFYISNISNYIQYNKSWAFILLIIFGSLAGIPPFSGFLPKILVLISLTENNQWYINLILIILSCIIIWYYINIITTIFMEIRLKNVNNTLQIIHYKILFDELEYSICCIGAFLLIFIFINPTLIYIPSQYFTLYIL